MATVHSPRGYRWVKQPHPENQSGLYIYVHQHRHTPSKIATSDDKDHEGLEAMPRLIPSP